MEFSNKCPFCENTKFINNELANSPTKEAILYEDDKLYVRVDISPLCRGHIMIIPKNHFFNFFELPNDLKEKTQNLMSNIKKIYKDLYNSDVIFFEHGSIKRQNAGSSIDHAHLHAIPKKIEINNDVEKVLGIPKDFNIIKNSNKLYDGNPYIYIENTDESKLYNANKLPSQFLRKIVLNKQGCEEYKWQEKCTKVTDKNLIFETINDLKNKIYI